MKTDHYRHIREIKRIPTFSKHCVPDVMLMRCKAKSLGRENIFGELANDVSGGRVLAHEVVSRCACRIARDEGATDGAATLPHQLGKVTSGVRVLTSLEVVLRSLVIPKSNSGWNSALASFQVLSIWTASVFKVTCSRVRTGVRSQGVIPRKIADLVNRTVSVVNVEKGLGDGVGSGRRWCWRWCRWGRIVRCW